MGNTPNIRFKGFTEAWEQRKFGDLGSVAMCKRVFKEQTTPVGEIPFYKIGTFGAEPDAFISRELFEEYKSKFQYPNVGDMLISASGTIGRTVEYSGEEAYFQDSNIVWFKHDDRIDNSFLRCIYNIVKWNGIEGSTIKRLYNDNFLKTEFYMPTTGEQAKIGAYFRSLDHLITLHQQKCAEIKELKKYMLQNMFPQKDEKVPKIRFAGFTGDWKQRKLPEFVSFFNGLTYTPDDVEETGTLVLRSSNVKNGEIVDADNVYVNGKVVTSENVQKGDIIVVVRNGSRALIGKHAQIKASMPKTVIGAFMSGIRSEHSSFVNALLDTSAFENEIAKNMGATINQITGYMFSKMEFMIPSGEEQQQIGECFQRLDNLITLHQQKCAALKEFKKYMLQNMFPQKGENKCQN